MSSTTFTRRRFLGSAAAGAAGLMLGSLRPARAIAQSNLPPSSRRFIFAYFEGGWDILLGLDPRDPATTTPEAQQIDPGYSLLGALGQRGERGVQRAGDLAFGPAVPPELLAHAEDLNIINGVGMDTASHEVGRRYFITGQFPRGIAAVGSSVPAEIAAQLGDASPIPHMAAAVEAYARELPSFATPFTVNSANDLFVALTPFVEVDPAVLAAVEAYQDEDPGCTSQRLDRDGLATRLLENQQRARGYIEQQLSEVFNYLRQDAEMVALRERYGIQGNSNPSSPEVLSFIAGQAIKSGISQAVSVRLAQGLDTHSNWAQTQPTAQEQGFLALAALISDLKATPLPSDASRSVFDETTLVVFSEFARTPLFNNLNGRDHFLGNSALVAGAGLRRGLTVGRSAEVGMMPIFTNLETGAGIENPPDDDLSSGRVVTLSPKHVLATVLASAGLNYDYLRVEPIRALLA